jgi:peptide/nickel transport system permease protein
MSSLAELELTRNQVEPAPGRSGLFRQVWGTAEGKVGFFILGAFVFVVIFGGAIAPYGVNDIGVSLPNAPPSSHFLLGTDDLGRDVLSRMLVGARSVIVIPVLATLLAFLIGGTAGMYAGYKGGRTDAVIGRVIDVLVSLPYLLVVLVIVSVLSPTTTVLVVAVALVFAPRIGRVLRGATKSVAQLDFVKAADARGEPSWSIVAFELLPNIAPTAFVEFAARLTYAIIFVATLNFLGLGLQPPSPNWAVMVAESEDTIISTPFQTVAPALAIGMLSVGVSLIADAMTRGIGRSGTGSALQ